MSLKTGLALIVILFISGLVITQHFINISLFDKLSESTRKEASESEALSAAQNQARQPLWLQRVNYYRSLVGLPPVTNASALSRADVLHSRYLVKYKIRTDTWPFAHTEDPKAPYYTPQGLKAAEHSDLAERDGAQISGEQAVDSWMNGPFHRLAILYPEARQAGLGSYTEDGFEAIALYLQVPLSPPHPFGEPVKFPPPDSVVPLAIYEAGEWPDPLATCPGYAAPAGLPVTLQLGAWVPVQVTAHSFTHDGKRLEHCVFDAATYRNPNQATEHWAQNVLKGSSAVVLMPRVPLASGQSYTVSITANGTLYRWSFAVR